MLVNNQSKSRVIKLRLSELTSVYWEQDAESEKSAVKFWKESRKVNSFLRKLIPNTPLSDYFQKVSLEPSISPI